LGIQTRVLPGCYQNTPQQDDRSRHPAILDRFGWWA
jgi:hypothetical protein